MRGNHRNFARLQTTLKENTLLFSEWNFTTLYKTYFTLKRKSINDNLVFNKIP